MLSFNQPISVRFKEFLKTIFRMGLFVKNFPNNKTNAKSKFIIVGFIYKKTGLSKYIVRPPNKVISIPLNNGIGGIFFF